MSTPSETDTVQLVQHYRSEAAGYRKQWATSAGIGCAGAAIALVSLAANLPDPDYAFRLFAPSLWLFLFGVVTSTASLLVYAQRSESVGEHFAAAFNREQYQSAARKLPEIIASAQRLADEANVVRNSLIIKGDEAHSQAEAAWVRRGRWGVLLSALLTASALSFVIGVGLPLVYISVGGSLATPAQHPPASSR